MRFLEIDISEVEFYTSKDLTTPAYLVPIGAKHGGIDVTYTAGEVYKAADGKVRGKTNIVISDHWQKEGRFYLGYTREVNYPTMWVDPIKKRSFWLYIDIVEKDWGTTIKIPAMKTCAIYAAATLQAIYKMPRYQPVVQGLDQLLVGKQASVKLLNPSPDMKKATVSCGGPSLEFNNNHVGVFTPTIVGPSPRVTVQFYWYSGDLRIREMKVYAAGTNITPTLIQFPAVSPLILKSYSSTLVAGATYTAEIENYNSQLTYSIDPSSNVIPIGAITSKEFSYRALDSTGSHMLKIVSTLGEDTRTDSYPFVIKSASLPTLPMPKLRCINIDVPNRPVDIPLSELSGVIIDTTAEGVQPPHVTLFQSENFKFEVLNYDPDATYTWNGTSQFSNVSFDKGSLVASVNNYVPSFYYAPETNLLVSKEGYSLREARIVTLLKKVPSSAMLEKPTISCSDSPGVGEEFTVTITNYDLLQKYKAIPTPFFEEVSATHERITYKLLKSSDTGYISFQMFNYKRGSLTMIPSDILKINVKQGYTPPATLSSMRIAINQTQFHLRDPKVIHADVGLYVWAILETGENVTVTPGTLKVRRGVVYGATSIEINNALFDTGKVLFYFGTRSVPNLKAKIYASSDPITTSSPFVLASLRVVPSNFNSTGGDKSTGYRYSFADLGANFELPSVPTMLTVEVI